MKKSKLVRDAENYNFSTEDKKIYKWLGYGGYVISVVLIIFVIFLISEC